jgi:hypothetical protein
MVNAPAPFLLYIPGFSTSAHNTAMRIAELIAFNASDQRSGTYLATEKPASMDFGGLSGATIHQEPSQPVLNVVEVPYRHELNIGDGSSTSGFKGFFNFARYALLATIRLKGAWRRGAKSSEAKRQLLYGLLLVLSLYVSVILIGLALLVAWKPSLFPSWLASDRDVVQWSLTAGGVSLAGFFWWVRPRLLQAGRHVRDLMAYVENDRHRREVSATVGRAVDKLLEVEANVGAPIHVLAYSFGSIVILDALCPPETVERHERLALVQSLVTVGCPVDIVRLYYPDYFDQRLHPRLEIPWCNLFIPADVLGSNLLDNDDRSQNSKALFSIANFKPSKTSPWETLNSH